MLTTLPTTTRSHLIFFPSRYRESLSEFFVRTGFRVIASKQVFTCRMTLKEFHSKGGRSHRGTEFAKQRAKKAAQTRWAKHRKELKQQPDATTQEGSNE